MLDYSFQLYSARNFQPWGEVLNRLAGMGYSRVEGFGGVFEDPAAFRSMMDSNGITMPSAHFGIEALEGAFDEVLRTCEVLGIQNIYCPFLMPDQRPDDRAGWEGFAGRLSAIGDRIRAEGRTFGWHNHDFEFRPAKDGSVPMEVLLQAAPEISWEADIAWVIRGGADPMEWIGRCGDRITAVHVKDIAPEGECLDEDGWADVGHGIVAWKNLMRALREKSTASLFIMEHDNPSDFGRFASRSIEAANEY